MKNFLFVVFITFAVVLSVLNNIAIIKLQHQVAQQQTVINENHELLKHHLLTNK